MAKETVKSLEDYYNYFIAAGNEDEEGAQGSVVSDYNLNAQHCIPTVDYGEQCDRLQSPYIGNCNFDGAQHALSTLKLIDGDSKKGSYVSDNLLKFEQVP